MSKNIRIRTEPNGGDTHLKVQLNQDFDFLEILSLKISQEDVYRTFYSDYGVVVGRVIINSGVGVPNAKVSIFIPLNDADIENPEISAIYPYTDITTVNSDGVRYNVLPNGSQGECHTPVGTFPSKRELVDNEILLDIHQKYYKYNTTTNDSGDFMIFGVPVGNHMINVDVDLSDIGIFSQRPYDFIAQGIPSKNFESTSKFKGGTNLNNLSQLKNTQMGINVIPFWGEDVENEVGISRIDVDLNYNLEPKAIFMGAIFGDTDNNSVNKNCRARKKVGKVCEMTEGGGTIEMIRKNIYGEIESFTIEGGKLIDDNGAWAYQIPMNLDYVVTDEEGNLIPTDDTSKGFPTRTKVRFKIDMNETGGDGRVRTKAKYLVPHNPDGYNDTDYTFDSTTPDSHFRELHWNKVYTVKNFVSRFQRNNNKNNRNFIGFKDVDDCPGLKNSLPFNTVDSDFNPLFFVLCIIINIILGIIKLINNIITLELKIGPFRVRPFNKLVGCIPLTCPSGGVKYTPGCTNKNSNSGNNSLEDIKQCLNGGIAETLNVFEFDFYNNWLNGSLYSFLLKYKKKKSGENFCGDDSTRGTNYLLNSNLPKNPISSKSLKYKDLALDEGVVFSDGNEIFYRPISKSGYLLYATDIYNLGSVFDCDWQGEPKTHNELIPTTYQRPPTSDDANSDDSEPLQHDLLFRIACDGIEFSHDYQARNLNRICEIGVDIIKNDDIPYTNFEMNEDNISGGLLRNKLIALNTSQYNSSDIYTMDSDFNSADYKNYLNEGINSLPQNFGNSFYFYFGTKPNKTALDLMNSKYFIKCAKDVDNDNFSVIADVTNITVIGVRDGAINLTVSLGVEPYTYSWTGPDGFVSTSKDIINLDSGTYDVIVTDNNGEGLKIIKRFHVDGINLLSADVTTVNTQTSTSNNGKILINSILGGLTPYIATITGGSLSSPIIFNNFKGSEIIDNLGVGTYNINVTDSSDQDIDISAIIMIPDTLVATYIVTPVTCQYSNDAIIAIDIQGGTPEYFVRLTNIDGATYTNLTASGLPPDTYTLVVEDSYGQITAEQTIIISEGVALILDSGFKLTNTVIGSIYELSDGSNTLIETKIATGTTVQFTVQGSGTYTVNDSNSDCVSNSVTI